MILVIQVWNFLYETHVFSKYKVSSAKIRLLGVYGLHGRKVMVQKVNVLLIPAENRDVES